MKNRLIQTNRLFSDPVYQDYLARTARLEKDRIFCRHDIAHFMDVARIAALMAMDEGLVFDQDLLYTIALLHDIGRFREYEEGIPHEKASMELSRELLIPLDFSQREKEQILAAVSGHRTPGQSGLNGLFYRADKASRACHSCPVRAACSWSDEKKNLQISI